MQPTLPIISPGNPFLMDLQELKLGCWKLRFQNEQANVGADSFKVQ